MSSAPAPGSTFALQKAPVTPGADKKILRRFGHTFLLHGDKVYYRRGRHSLAVMVRNAGGRYVEAQ
jgi:hypothetical protein